MVLHPFVDVQFTSLDDGVGHPLLYDYWGCNVLRDRTLPELQRNRQLASPGIEWEAEVQRSIPNPHMQPREEIVSFREGVEELVRFPGTKLTMTAWPDAAWETNDDVVLTEADKLSAVRVLGRYKYPLLYELVGVDAVRFLNIYFNPQAPTYLTWFLTHPVPGERQPDRGNLTLVEDRDRSLVVRDAVLARQFRAMTAARRRRHRDAVDAGLIAYEDAEGLPSLSREVHDMMADVYGPAPVFSQMQGF